MQIQIQFFIPYNVQDKRTIRVEKKERKKENGCKSTKFQTVRNSRTLSLRCYSGVRSLEWSSYFSHYFFVLHIAQALDPCFPLVNLSGLERKGVLPG